MPVGWNVTFGCTSDDDADQEGGESEDGGEPDEPEDEATIAVEPSMTCILYIV